MQDHDGNGTCNSNPNYNPTANAALIKTPCPQSEITQMISDGTAGPTPGVDSLAYA